MKLATEIVLLVFTVIFGFVFIEDQDSTRKPQYLLAMAVMVLLILVIQFKWQ